MAANLVAVGEKIREAVTPVFAELGIAVDSFVVENLSLPEELQKRLDERVGMNMLGNMQQYTQFQAAQSLPIAAANEGGGFAAIGAGLAAGVGMGGVMMNAMSPALARRANRLRRLRRLRRPRPRLRRLRRPSRVGSGGTGGSGSGRGGRCGRGDEVLLQLRPEDSARGQILRRMRTSQPAV